MNLEKALAYASEKIKFEDSDIDAKYLLSYIFNENFTWLKTWQDTELTSKQIELLEQLITRRKNGEPVAYITGEKAFWSLTLETNSSTLIPRPETELLVEQALSYLIDTPKAKVLDLGTGTGAIALAIASERKNDLVIACDFVDDAVKLAIRNAKKNDIKNINIIQSDWFSNIEHKDFDLIISNPPYIEENDPHLRQGDLRFEPNSALIAKDNGFADIKTIIKESQTHLVDGGCLMIEHGYEQGETLRGLLLTAGYSNIETLKDYSNLERITSARYSSKVS